MEVMFHRAARRLILAALVFAASAADKVTLTCTGKFASQEGNFKDEPAGNHYVLIDIDQGTVAGTLGHFTISGTQETMIAFGSQTPPSHGLVDRISGVVTVEFYGRDGDIDHVYALTCKRANALF
jgi:hypothetical protein